MYIETVLKYDVFNHIYHSYVEFKLFVIYQSLAAGVPYPARQF